MTTSKRRGLPLILTCLCFSKSLLVNNFLLDILYFFINACSTVDFNSMPFSLSLQPLTAFAELSYGRRDFAKTEGRKTEKGEVSRTRRRRGGGWVKNILKSQNGVQLARRTTEQE